MTAQLLLSDDLMAWTRANITRHNQMAGARNHIMRMSEGNSFYGGGLAGMSDTYAAALWTAGE